MSSKPHFDTFYKDHYLAEHYHPANVALHVVGTIAGIALVFTALFGAISLWWMLAFPIVHASPGLIGHKLFERSDAAGSNNRILRSDFPLYWFIIANHMSLWKLVTGTR